MAQKGRMDKVNRKWETYKGDTAKWEIPPSPQNSQQDPSIYLQAQPFLVCLYTQPPPQYQQLLFREWTPLNRGLHLFHLPHAAGTHLFPFSGQFIHHLLSTYLKLALDVRNISHSSSYFNPRQRDFIIRKMRPRDVN